MGMRAWARKEVELVCKELSNDDPYTKECYNSALRAFNSLCDDGHSGLSISITESILERLIKGKPLSAIQDTDYVWALAFKREDTGSDVYQCTRMSSLFKDVLPDGTVIYDDIDRVICCDIDKPEITYHSGIASKVINEMYPITMPYTPSSKPYIVYREDFVYSHQCEYRCVGNYDTIGIYYAITPEGIKVEINKFFKETESGEMVEITKEEYDERKK